MDSPVQIQFRNMPYSLSLEQAIQKKVDKLLSICDRITTCRVAVEALHRHHQYGVIYHVNIEVWLPGRTLAVSREPEINGAHKDPWVAVRDSFDAMRRQLLQHLASWQEKGRHRADNRIPAMRGVHF